MNKPKPEALALAAKAMSVTSVELYDALPYSGLPLEDVIRLTRE